jgi:hypothetical protein
MTGAVLAPSPPAALPAEAPTGFSPPAPGSQNGIQAGNFAVSAELLVNDVPTDWLKIDVTLTAYVISGQIAVSVPITSYDATGVAQQIDYGALAQANPFLPIRVRIGYADASTVKGPVPMFDLEWGIIDQIDDQYDADLSDLTGRSSAAVFQDTLLTGQALFSQLGSDVAQICTDKAYALAPSVFNSYNIKKSPATSVPVGKTGVNEQEFLKARRARSMWDEMLDAALGDAFILRFHNGNFYYGPPAADNQVPLVTLHWIGSPANPKQGDMLTCKVTHGARRSHAITVRVDGYDPKKKVHNSVTSGPSGFGGVGSIVPTKGVQYRFVHNPGDLLSLKALAYKVWHDLVHREFIATVELVPDAQLMQTIAKSGVDFLVQLNGVKPSAQLLYQVRQAEISVEAGDSDEPYLKVKMLLANYQDQVGGGAELLS